MEKSKKIGILVILLLVIAGVFAATYWYWYKEVSIVNDNDSGDGGGDDIPLEDLLAVKKDYMGDEDDLDYEGTAFYSTTGGNLEFEKVWDDSGSGADKNLAVWRPTVVPGYAPIGDIASDDDNGVDDAQRVLFVRDDPAYSAMPTNYKPVWSSDGYNLKKPIAFWEAVCPDKYKSMGHLASEDVPDQDSMRCVHESVLEATDLKNEIWNSEDAKKTEGSKDVSVWNVWGSSTFMAGGVKPKEAWRFKSN